MKYITMMVEGIPKPQPRVKAYSRGGRAGVYTPKSSDEWKGKIIAAAKPHLPETPIEGLVEVGVIYYLPRPQRLMRKSDPEGTVPHDKKPDIDNLNKAVFDALTRAGMWKDDSQVYKSIGMKYYHCKDGRPGATIKITYEEIVR